MSALGLEPFVFFSLPANEAGLSLSLILSATKFRRRVSRKVEMNSGRGREDILVVAGAKTNLTRDTTG
jgi:hypothetical protein